MATQHSVDEAEIRQRIDRLVEAIRGADLEGLRPLYATGIVSFDVRPPLRCLGVDAKLGNWVDAFTTFQQPLDYVVRDLTIIVDGDLAVAYSLNQLSGTLKSGNRGGAWVRATLCFRKIDGNRLIAHDHASVPVDPQSGRALLDLEP
jgi:ketosteroid isomerase-like protein